MYISKIVLKNIRCFPDFKLRFKAKQRSVLLVGDNGEGKSTLLRSIAMGLCDESSAAALFRELPGKFIRRSRKKGKTWIRIHLSDAYEGPFIIKTEIQSLGSFERVKQHVYRVDEKLKRHEIEQEEFPWSRMFVTGYGAGVRMLGSETLDQYLPVDGVYSLFRYDEPLLNPELALRRLEAEGKKRGKEVLDVFLELLRAVLNLEKDDRVYLEKTGIEIRSRWGRYPLETLGDGYRSSVTWVLDLIGRRLLFGKTLSPERMTGIVLLDEVEQHLHPKWQLNVMPLLMKAFPRIQFIATTHSPLVVSGCEECKIRKTTSDHDERSNAYGWLAEDVYREVLGLRTSRAAQLEEGIGRYQHLHSEKLSRKLNSEEKAELKDIDKMFNRLPGTDPAATLAKLRALHRRTKCS